MNENKLSIQFDIKSHDNLLEFIIDERIFFVESSFIIKKLESIGYKFSK